MGLNFNMDKDMNWERLVLGTPNHYIRILANLLFLNVNRDATKVTKGKWVGEPGYFRGKNAIF